MIGNYWVLVILIVLVIIINFKELLNSNTKGKLILIYLSIMGLSCLIIILIIFNHHPLSPTEIIYLTLEKLGLPYE